MSDDKDNVRVDLLKFRRKAYLSYPEGSIERKNFLKTVLETELRLTEQDIPRELINFIVDGNREAFKKTMKQFFIWFGWAVVNSGIYAWMFSDHKLFSFVFLFTGVGCMTVAFQHLYEYWAYRKSVKTVKQYSQEMQQYMNRISNDIKRLEGPR